MSNVKTIIIDEIHNLVGGKRGSHLSLTIERLQALNQNTIHRIGLSATQKPIEKVAAFLTGVNKKGKPLPCSIIDTGHSRKLDIDIAVPNSSLTAVMDKEVWEELYLKVVKLIQEHETTLIFVNTRRLAERLSQKISDLLGEDQVAAHHGSMSKDHRLEAEQKLKAGTIKTIVATASLELGIDIGSIDLVVQIGSPRSIAVFLQRVGRAGHQVKATPKGRLFPLTRDELVESVAIFDAIKRGELDEIIMPEEPLDIMAQQIVAEAGNRDIKENELFNIIKKAFSV